MFDKKKMAVDLKFLRDKALEDLKLAVDNADGEDKKREYRAKRDLLSGYAITSFSDLDGKYTVVSNNVWMVCVKGTDYFKSSPNAIACNVIHRPYKPLRMRKPLDLVLTEKSIRERMEKTDNIIIKIGSYIYRYDKFCVILWLFGDDGPTYLEECDHTLFMFNADRSLMVITGSITDELSPYDVYTSEKRVIKEVPKKKAKKIEVIKDVEKVAIVEEVKAKKVKKKKKAKNMIDLDNLGFFS